MLKTKLVKLFEKYYVIKYFLIKKKEIDYKKEFRKIALILTSPLGIGDLIMMTPVIASFRKQFPRGDVRISAIFLNSFL
jgi:hypothetical protein